MSDLVEVRDTIMREVYSEAEPGLDWDDLLENPDEYPDDWYEQHTLPAEREREIFDKHCDEFDVGEQERTALTMTCILDLGPSNPTEEA